MKPKTIVTLVLLVIGISVAYAAIRRSGLDRALGDLFAPAAGAVVGSGSRGGGGGGGTAAAPAPSTGAISPVTAAGAISRVATPSAAADVMVGPISGSAMGGGPGLFGPTASPLVNSIAVTLAGVPKVQAPSAPASGASPPSVVVGTIGPTIASPKMSEIFVAAGRPLERVTVTLPPSLGGGSATAETVRIAPSGFLESLPSWHPRSSNFDARAWEAAGKPTGI